MSRNALVVGVNSYQRLNPLKTPTEDAEAVASPTSPKALQKAT